MGIRVQLIYLVLSLICMNLATGLGEQPDRNNTDTTIEMVTDELTPATTTSTSHRLLISGDGKYIRGIAFDLEAGKAKKEEEKDESGKCKPCLSACEEVLEILAIALCAGFLLTFCVGGVAGWVAARNERRKEKLCSTSITMQSIGVQVPDGDSLPQEESLVEEKAKFTGSLEAIWITPPTNV